MIIARDIAIEAGIRRLISHASFTVNATDKIGLVGANGAGKTTLLRTLAGEFEPAEGTIVRSNVIGYLSQEAALVESATSSAGWRTSGSKWRRPRAPSETN